MHLSTHVACFYWVVNTTSSLDLDSGGSPGAKGSQTDNWMVVVMIDDCLAECKKSAY